MIIIVRVLLEWGEGDRYRYHNQLFFAHHYYVYISRFVYLFLVVKRAHTFSIFLHTYLLMSVYFILFYLLCGERKKENRTEQLFDESVRKCCLLPSRCYVQRQLYFQTLFCLFLFCIPLRYSWNVSSFCFVSGDGCPIFRLKRKRKIESE